MHNEATKDGFECYGNCHGDPRKRVGLTGFQKQGLDTAPKKRCGRCRKYRRECVCTESNLEEKDASQPEHVAGALLLFA